MPVLIASSFFFFFFSIGAVLTGSLRTGKFGGSPYYIGCYYIP